MAYALIFSDLAIQNLQRRVGVVRSQAPHRVATLLRENGHTIDVVDFINDFSLQEILQIIKIIVAHSPIFIGISSSLTTVMPYWEEVKAQLKSLLPNVPIIVFGAVAVDSGYSDADYYIEGFSEEAMLVMTNYILTGINPPIYCQLNGKKIIDATKDYLVNTKKYSLSTKFVESDFVTDKDMIIIELSRGCIFSCSFCDHCLTGTKKGEHSRRIDDVVDELIYNYTRWGITKCFIGDPTFNDSDEKVDMLVEIANRLPFKLQALCFLRADLLMKKPTAIDKLVNAGIVAAHMGLESFNPKTTKSVNKGSDSELIKLYLAEIKQRHPSLFIFTTLIVGLPFDSIANQYSSMEWLMREKVVDSWWFAPLCIKKVTNNFEILSRIATDYKSYNYKVMTNEQVEKFKSKNEDVKRGARGKRGDANLVKWENDEMNFYQAIECCNDINKKSNQFSKLNPWSFFPASVVYKDLDWWLHQNESYNFDELVQKSEQYVGCYKKQKMLYFNQDVR